MGSMALPSIRPGLDGVKRCGWCLGAPDYVAYHDDEWGRPVVDDTRLLEKLCLEGFQAGLSWLTILRKREAFRRAFAGFDRERLARFAEPDVTRLLGDAGIVRHRGKIEAAIANARAACAVAEREGSLAALVWRFEPAPSARPRRLTGRGAGPAHRDAGVCRALEGAEAAGLPLRRPDHRLRLHAGHGPGERSPRRLPRPGGGGAGAECVPGRASVTPR